MLCVQSLLPHPRTCCEERLVARRHLQHALDASPPQHTAAAVADARKPRGPQHHLLPPSGAHGALVGEGGQGQRGGAGRRCRLARRLLLGCLQGIQLRYRKEWWARGRGQDARQCETECRLTQHARHAMARAVDLPARLQPTARSPVAPARRQRRRRGYTPTRSQLAPARQGGGSSRSVLLMQMNKSKSLHARGMHLRCRARACGTVRRGRGPAGLKHMPDRLKLNTHLQQKG